MLIFFLSYIFPMLECRFALIDILVSKNHNAKPTHTQVIILIILKVWQMELLPVLAAKPISFVV